MKFVSYSKVALLLCAGSLAYANPENPTVITGDVSFDTSTPDLLNVTSTDYRSIVEWETFSNSSSETVTFTLPSSTSAILNRVTTENISDIYGSITSNGQVYLINPNGIIFRDSSVVSTGAILASTMDVDNQEFLDGDEMLFTGVENSDVMIINHGTINSDSDITLLSYQINNFGTLNATNGVVAAGAGLEIVFVPNNDPRITIVAASPTSPITSGLDLQGQINAFRAELRADGNLYQYAINTGCDMVLQGGILGNSYLQMTSEEGTVVVNGSIQCTDGNTGGVVEILGKDITIDSTAHIDVSADYGGGELYIGGGFGGNDPNLFNAENVLFHNDAIANADAYVSGNGGLVAIWSNDTTIFNGIVTSRGGATSGDGGFVEVSGHNNLYFFGTVDVTAANGSDGVFVLDPKHLIYKPAHRKGYTQAKPIIYKECRHKPHKRDNGPSHNKHTKKKHKC